MEYTTDIKEIHDTLKELHDIVTPTMGARGRLAMINENMDRPTLTDDGVTVVKQCRFMKGWQKMVAAGAIEAAHNTERVAYDGTTLTILLTYQFYKYGYDLINAGVHPNVVADQLQKDVGELKLDVMPLKSSKEVQDIATIATKIPRLGVIIKDAYKKAGKEMNVAIEHDRENQGVSIAHEKGYAIESGYFSESLSSLCNIGGNVTEFADAKVALLKQGIMTGELISKFFSSIPKEELTKPIVFFVSIGFNPEALRIVIETIVSNSLNAQFVFVNEPEDEELFRDLAAISNSKVQEAASGIKGYLFEHCGDVDFIRIEKDRTTIIGKGNVDKRIKTYNDRLSSSKYSIPESTRIIFERRMAALTNGITKIKVGVSTITEFKTLKLKLDDGIGAVRQAFKDGIVLGGGKALYNIDHPRLGTILKIPLLTICKNAGIKPNKKLLLHKSGGIDVTTGKYVDLKESGIIDGAAAVTQSLQNASSIACNYLRTYILIKEKI